MASASPLATMDQAVAQQLFHQGATLVLLDMPAGTEFGIDYKAWEVGPKFKGVKMIPPGIHFVYYSAVSSERIAAPRTGFFYKFKPREVLIKKWDRELEDIKDEIVSAEEQRRIEDGKVELDINLGAYPYEHYKKWISLTNHISEEVLENLQPLNRKISSVTELQSEPSNSQSRLQAAEKAANTPLCSTSTPEAQLPDLKRVPGSEIRFTCIPKRKFPEGSTPAEITKYSMDHSYVLSSIMNSSYSQREMDFLGELQFAFICFLVGQVYEGFEQWKRLTELLCSSEEAIGQYPDLFGQFISVVHYHVQEIPEDFFVDIVSRDNFLVAVLSNFFSNLTTSSAGDDLRNKGKKFRKHLQKRFNWDFSTESDDYAPVVVSSDSA